MLEIKNLKVAIEDKEILSSLNLKIEPGQVHVIMGPNGTGKSTLAHVLAGKEEYEIKEGSISFCGENLLQMAIEERARKGMFLAFQYPLEIPGVTSQDFIKVAINSIRKDQGLKELDSAEFLREIKTEAKKIQLDEQLLKRSLNEGFSGGEKKRMETLQLLMLKPKLAILDETDSGLDIDALQNVANAVNSMRDKKRAFLIITHYHKLLDYIKPDTVHVFSNGKIAKSGGVELAGEIERKGYQTTG